MTYDNLIRRVLCTSLALASVFIPAVAVAQADWPSKPVRIIVAFPPGGAADVTARQLAIHLSSTFGQQFVVENRSGASGNIGTDAVAKSTPDGYTLGLSSTGPLANNKSLFKTMPYDAQKDLTPIALVGEIPLVIVTNAALKMSNLKEFVAAIKANPSGYSAGHPGNGTIGHLAIELFKTSTGANPQAVPYRGDAPAMVDLLGGQIQAVFSPVTAFIPNIQAEKLRALAVVSKTRYPGLPNVPTAIEQGIDLDITAWFAVVGPAGLPKTLVTKLNQEINKYTNSAEGRAKVAQFGLVPANSSPEALAALMSSETVKWKKVVEAAKISLE